MPVKVSALLFGLLSAIVLVSMLPREAPVLRLPGSVRGGITIACGALMLYIFSNVVFERKDRFLRRALLLNPGAMLVFAGIGLLCEGHPESHGASILAGAGFLVCILASFVAFAIHLACRGRRADADASSRATTV